jgi:hypothetical protein
VSCLLKEAILACFASQPVLQRTARRFFLLTR